MKKDYEGFDLEDLKAMLKEDEDYVPNLQLPDPALLEIYKGDRDRVFWLAGFIDDNLTYLIKKIIECNCQDATTPVERRKPIKIFISSQGGNANIMWSLIQTIQASKTPVWTINLTYAYSAAAEILAAGHHRIALKGSTVMIHSGSCSLSGEQSSVESMQKFNKMQDQKYVKFLLEHTKIDPKFYHRKASSDIWYDENDALKYGIVDEIAETLEGLM